MPIPPARLRSWLWLAPCHITLDKSKVYCGEPRDARCPYEQPAGLANGTAYALASFRPLCAPFPMPSRRTQGYGCLALKNPCLTGTGAIRHLALSQFSDFYVAESKLSQACLRGSSFAPLSIHDGTIATLTLQNDVAECFRALSSFHLFSLLLVA